MSHTNRLLAEIIKTIFKNLKWENLQGVVANVLDYDILVREFELQTRHYVHIRERYNPLSP